MIRFTAGRDIIFPAVWAAAERNCLSTVLKAVWICHTCCRQGMLFHWLEMELCENFALLTTTSYIVFLIYLVLCYFLC